jgi:hypothetical protein
MFLAALIGSASSPIPSYKVHDPSFSFFLLFGAISIYSWFSYFVMGVAWVKNKAVKKWWPLTGTLAGFVALGPGFLTGAPRQEALLAFAASLFYVLPAFLLAVWMVVFHLRQGARKSALTNHSSGTR